MDLRPDFDVVQRAIAEITQGGSASSAALHAALDALRSA